MIGRLEITSNIPEINFMESILNMTGSGCDMTFGISLRFMLFKRKLICLSC